MSLFSRNIGDIAPRKGGFSITPNDSADLAEVAYGLTALVAGNVKVTTYDGDTLILSLVPGCTQPWVVKKVFATGGTTATGIVGGRK